MRSRRNFFFLLLCVIFNQNMASNDYQPVAVSSLAITKSENLAIVTGTCKPRLLVDLLIYSAPFVMSQNWEKQGCQ